MSEIYNKINELVKSGRTVLATIIKDDNPEMIGSKGLFANGEYLEKNDHQVWQEITNELADITCPKHIQVGNTQIFAEVASGSPKLIICGGGHISLPLVTVGKMLGFEVTVIDDRLAFAHKERFPDAANVMCKDFKEALSDVPEDANNYFVIVTRGHKYDQVCLRHILDKTHAYIGMIGSRSRVGLVKQAMLDDGVSQELVDTVYTPVGLRIGAETPEEIAISIMAEIIQVKSQHIAGSGFSKEIMNSLLDESKKGTPQSLITIVVRKGSAPRQAGTKMLVLPGGECIGTIGGGCVEAEVRKQAMLTLDDGKPRLLRVDMTGKDVEDEGMVCGGVVDVFIELA